MFARDDSIAIVSDRFLILSALIAEYSQSQICKVLKGKRRTFCCNVTSLNKSC